MALASSAPVAAQGVGALVGQVRDGVNGRGVPNVRVFLADRNQEALTDQEGRFVLSSVVAGERIIRAEAFGYALGEARATIRAGQTTEVDLTLQPRHVGLTGIVVTGTAAGAQEREISYSVGSIDVSEVVEPLADVQQLLTGRLPGVIVQQSGGNAGAGSQIRLRGNVSASLSNEPLVYVDGVRIRSDGYPENLPRVGSARLGSNSTPSPLNDINPADIERVEVVKGPAAATLFGAEAASGVVQIFTRRGREGPPVLDIEVGQGFDRVADFGTPGDPYLGMDAWLDNTAWRQRYSVSVGGGGAVRYFLSSSYDDADGVLPNDTEDRLTLRGNLDFEPREDLSLRWSSSHTIHDIQNTPMGLTRDGLAYNVYRKEQASVGDSTRATLSRVLDYDIDSKLDHTILAFTALHTPTGNWTNRLTVGYDRAAMGMHQRRPVGYILADQGVLSEEDWVNGILTAEYVGSFDLSLGRDLAAKVSVGAQSVTSTVTSDAGYAEGFDEGEELTIDGGELSLDFHNKVRVRTSGVFAEALVGYQDRLYLSGGLRFDGSTAFGDELGLQAYPRIGASYILSEEDFWPEEWGRIKLRAGYGHAGRAPGVVDEFRTWFLTDFAGDSAFIPGALGNPDLAPERTSELELGIEGAFLGERLVAELSYYRQRTHDALFPVTPVPSEGFVETQLVNVGSLLNNGFELTVDGNVVSGPSLGWDLGFYLQTNDSELTDLGGGLPLQVFDAGWITENAPVPTLIAPKILNPDEVADPVVEDDHVWGSTLPTHTLGFSTSLRVPRGVELSARGEYQGGHYVYDNISNQLARRDIYAPCESAYGLRDAGRTSEMTAWERTWCIPGNVPRNGGPIYPGDFFRLREVSLQAPIPSGLVGGSRATVTFSARNAWTWKNADFLVFDPEMVGDDGTHAVVRKIDAQIPAPASFTMLIRVTR